MNQRGFTIFDLLTFLGICLGILYGIRYGFEKQDIFGGLLGGFIGLGVGYFVGKLPYALVSAHANRLLENETSEKLRVRIRNGNEYYIIHLLLAHLMKRGENISNELPCIISLMCSDDFERRKFGWHALRLGYPEIATIVADYEPSNTVENCYSVMSRLEKPVRRTNRNP